MSSHTARRPRTAPSPTSSARAATSAPPLMLMAMPMQEEPNACSCGGELVTFADDGRPLCPACLAIVRRRAAGLRPSLTACPSCGLDHELVDRAPVLGAADSRPSAPALTGRESVADGVQAGEGGSKVRDSGAPDHLRPQIFFARKIGRHFFGAERERP